MRIAIGSDHAGVRMKTALVAALREGGHEVSDFGTHSDEPVDYPPIAVDVARAVVRGDVDRGIVLGGTGQGEQIAANKVAGVRAALCHDLFTAELSRRHNDANVLAMGARVIALELSRRIVALWLDTGFEGGRHQRRLDQIAEIEQSMDTGGN